MRATGRGSISSFLKIGVDVVWVIACALLGFIWIIAAFAIYALVTGNPTFLDVVGPSGANKLGTPLGLSIWIAIGSILCIGVMIVCAYLRGVFETLVAGDPFVPENATRFTAIAIVLAVMESVGDVRRRHRQPGVWRPRAVGPAHRVPVSEHQLPGVAGGCDALGAGAGVPRGRGDAGRAEDDDLSTHIHVMVQSLQSRKVWLYGLV
jgi:hypothetical protein